MNSNITIQTQISLLQTQISLLPSKQEQEVGDIQKHYNTLIMNLHRENPIKKDEENKKNISETWQNGLGRSLGIAIIISVISFFVTCSVACNNGEGFDSLSSGLTGAFIVGGLSFLIGMGISAIVTDCKHPRTLKKDEITNIEQKIIDEEKLLKYRCEQDCNAIREKYNTLREEYNTEINNISRSYYTKVQQMSQTLQNQDNINTLFQHVVNFYESLKNAQPVSRDIQYVRFNIELFIEAYQITIRGFDFDVNGRMRNNGEVVYIFKKLNIRDLTEYLQHDAVSFCLSQKLSTYIQERNPQANINILNYEDVTGQYKLEYKCINENYEGLTNWNM